MKLNDIMKIVLLVAALQIPVAIVIYGAYAPSTGSDISSAIIIMLLLLGFALVFAIVAFILYWLIRRYTTERTLKVALMTLAPDERKILEIIMQEGSIRQDDLRRKADMSKSKLSALVNNLEKKHAIIKVRHHKTNILEPTPEFKR